VCSKFVLPDDVECHLVMCLTKPRISYNEDVLSEDKGECVICLDDLKQGDTIARLPCLCIYHKSCIDSWFEVNRSCPEHPLDWQMWNLLTDTSARLVDEVTLEDNVITTILVIIIIQAGHLCNRWMSSSELAYHTPRTLIFSSSVSNTLRKKGLLRLYYCY